MITRNGTRTRCIECGAPTRTFDLYDRETLCDSCLAAEHEAVAYTVELDFDELRLEGLTISTAIA